jgi:diketogulonate reductase-like aldo/keto reductase
VQNLKQNLGALNMRLSAEEVATIRDLVDKAGVAKVDRYPAAMQKMLYVETPALNTWKAE